MAGLEVSIRVENLDKVRDALGRLSGPQARQAYAKALNDTGRHVQAKMKAEYRATFDQPTAYIISSPWVEFATEDSLAVTVAPGTANRKKPGVDPQKILQAQEFGGNRRDKRFEVALRRRGLLPAGMQIALPSEKYGGPFPGSDDGKGNFTGGFVQQLLAFLKTSAADFSAMSRRDRTASHKKGYSVAANIRTRRETMLLNGWAVAVIASPGRGPGLGIWARKGGELRCMVAFVSRASYSPPKLSMDKVVRDADLQEYLDRRVRFRVREAAGV